MRRALVLVVLLVACGDDEGRVQTCAEACGSGEVCRYSTCVPSPTSCTATDDCAGDFYCDTSAHECLPWGVGPGGASDPTCVRELTPGAWLPKVQCQWGGPLDTDAYPAHTQVLSTPVVAGNTIAFIAYNGTDGGQPACTGTSTTANAVIRVIDGATCGDLAVIANPKPIPTSTLAIADLDRDGVPEIIAAVAGGGVAAWKRQPTNEYTLLWQSTVATAAGQCVWTGPAVHDLDDDGSPEVIYYGAVFDAQGRLRNDAGLLATGLSGGYVPVVADLDRDGVVELVSGSRIFSWDAVTSMWTQGAQLPGDAHVAVADLGTYGPTAGSDDRATLDGIAEVIWVRGTNVAAYTKSGRQVFGPVAIPGGGNGGPPAVGDFDGDGRVEIAVAGSMRLAMLDPDSGTVAWSVPITASSSETSASAFDFDADGKVEVVSGDACFARVLDGTTGDVVMSYARDACTYYDEVPIADVDGDFMADLVIASGTCAPTCPAIDPLFDGVRCDGDDDCGGMPCVAARCRCQGDSDCGNGGLVCRDPIAGPSTDGRVCRAGHGAAKNGVFVISDQLGRFAGTRPIWNQHAFANTNVLDNGRVPRTGSWEPAWLDPATNGFRMGQAGRGGLLADLTLRNGCRDTAAITDTLAVEVCNRGTRGVGSSGFEVLFTSGATTLCAAVLTSPLYPGFCQRVTCTASSTGTVTATIIGSPECRTANNTLDFGASCR